MNAGRPPPSGGDRRWRRRRAHRVTEKWNEIRNLAIPARSRLLCGRTLSAILCAPFGGPDPGIRTCRALRCAGKEGLANGPAGAVSSAVEHYLDMVGVTGSIPVLPTTRSISYLIGCQRAMRTYPNGTPRDGAIALTIRCARLVARELRSTLRLLPNSPWYAFVLPASMRPRNEFFWKSTRAFARVQPCAVCGRTAGEQHEQSPGDRDVLHEMREYVLIGEVGMEEVR